MLFLIAQKGYFSKQSNNSMETPYFLQFKGEEDKYGLVGFELS
jgi:hypothetical protein